LSSRSLVISSFLNSFSIADLFLNHYRIVLRHADVKVSSGLYNSNHNSFQFANDNLKYIYTLRKYNFLSGCSIFTRKHLRFLCNEKKKKYKDFRDDTMFRIMKRIFLYFNFHLIKNILTISHYSWTKKKKKKKKKKKNKKKKKKIIK